MLQFWVIRIALLLLFVDTYTFMDGHQDIINTSIKELDDKGNNLPEDNWLNKINPNQYQAIIPLPYFHVGSENLWLEPNSDILKNTFIVSLKTGLPTTGVAMSRTSLSQTFNQISLLLEPYRKLEILKRSENRYKPCWFWLNPMN